MDRLVDHLEAERHIGAGVPIRHRKNINPVDVFPASEKVPDRGGQSPHHALGINVSNGLGQN